MYYLAFLLLVIALLLFRTAKHARMELGLPGGKIIYADTSQWQPLEKSLYSPTFGLTGKPDYIIQKGEQVIPVEVKSTPIQHSPYDSHIYQLAAYCLLIEETFGKRPPYGILHYSPKNQAPQSFEIAFTKQLEEATLNILNEMRSHTRRSDVARSHEIPGRCAKCGFRSQCDQALV